MADTITFDIPLTPKNQFLSVILNGVDYHMRLIFNQTTDENACWILDINDANDNPIVCGIPLVTGVDLLEQYAYLGIGVSLFCFTDGNSNAIPTATNLGVSSHVRFLVGAGQTEPPGFLQ
jgi:hypothetical protein